LAGGGNTSFKDGSSLYVKGSGTSLATITAEGFVGMDRGKLGDIMEKEYDKGSDEKREAEVLADLLAARLPGEESKRPSVETLLHNLFPQTYVLHIHPSIVNGLTCSKRGEAKTKRLFGKTALWIDACRPGYALARLCHGRLAAYKERTGNPADTLFLENHGIFFAADTVEGIDALVSFVFATLEQSDAITPDHSPVDAKVDAAAVGEIKQRIIECAKAGMGIEDAYGETVEYAPVEDPVVQFSSNVDILRLAATRTGFLAVSAPFTPDHIVYCKARFLYIDEAEEAESPEGKAGKSSEAKAGKGSEPKGGENPEHNGADGSEASNGEEEPSNDKYAVADSIKGFLSEYGYWPRVICVSGVGVFALASGEKLAKTVSAVFQDAADIAVYSQNYGGPKPMPTELVNFIENWEVESYRASVK
jgi:rhamnose utilization protein RhaD (predicted bifunctional aldolase and dehydrogenase)